MGTMIIVHEHQGWCLPPRLHSPHLAHCHQTASVSQPTAAAAAALVTFLPLPAVRHAAMV